MDFNYLCCQNLKNRIDIAPKLKPLFRDLIKKITKLSTRWHQNESTFQKGIITHEVKSTESNRLNDALTDLILDLNN